MEKSFINQYKLFFISIWLIPYFVFPAWALPVSQTSRHIIIGGLFTYFAISLIFLNRWLSALNLDRPFIIQLESWLKIIKKHSGLAVMCVIAVLLHVHPIITRPILIIGDEPLHLQGGLWIYNYIDNNYHKYNQLLFWTLLVIIIFIQKNRTIRNYLNNKFSSSGYLSTKFIIVFIFSFLSLYFLFLKDLSFYPEVRYPPFSRLLYLLSYLAFGINPIGPRVIELVFYLLTAVYIYRIINLYANTDTALLGASVYLFLPVTYIYASLGELACSTVFFIVLISFHYLRFLQNRDHRDIVLTSFFIGAGFLYKQPVFLMFFICTTYLIYSRMKDRKLSFLTYFKVMLISLVPIIPWMIIQKYYAWRNYRIILSNLIPPDGMGYSHFMYLPIETSWVVFVLFIFSIFLIAVFKRNNLFLFFSLLFAAYYLFLALDQLSVSPRMLMAFGPTISIFAALCISFILNKVKWKHSFRLVFVALISYLILHNTVPSLNAAFLGQPEFIKMQDYPAESAVKWVKDNVKNEEKVLSIRVMTAMFYADKYGIDKKRIINLWYDEIKAVDSPEKLKKFSIENEITYIMFPYGVVYDEYFPILKYLKENANSEFTKVAEYNMGENFIFVYKYKNYLK